MKKSVAQVYLLILIAILIFLRISMLICKPLEHDIEENAKQWFVIEEKPITSKQESVKRSKMLCGVLSKFSLVGLFESKVISNQALVSDNEFLQQKTLIKKTKDLFLNIVVSLNDWGVKVKKGLLDKMTNSMTSSSYRIVAGMTIGLEEKLPRVLSHKLKIIGMLHIVSVSGYNVNLLVSILDKVLSSIFQKLRSILIIFFIVFYVFIVGFGASILRASLMMIFTLILRRIFYRQAKPLVSLYWSCAILLVINPSYIESISFQLSVAATWGIIVLLSNKESSFVSHFLPGESVFTKQPKSKSFLIGFYSTKIALTKKKTVFEAATRSIFSNLHDSFRVTTAAQLAVLPITIFHFGEVSLISMFANTFLLWLTPIITLSGLFVIIATNLLYLVYPIDIVSKVISLFVLIPVEVFIVGVDWFSRFEWAFLSVDITFSFIWMFVYWFGLWFVFSYKRWLKL